MTTVERLVPPPDSHFSRSGKIKRLLFSPHGLSKAAPTSDYMDQYGIAFRSMGYFAIGSSLLLITPSNPKDAVVPVVLGTLLNGIMARRTARLDRAFVNPPNMAEVESSWPEDRPTVHQAQEFAQMVKLLIYPDVVERAMIRKVKVDVGDGLGQDRSVEIKVAVKFDDLDAKTNRRRHMYGLTFDVKLPTDVNIYEYLASSGYRISDDEMEHLLSWTTEYSDIKFAIKSTTTVTDIKDRSIETVGKGNATGNLIITGFRPSYHATIPVVAVSSEPNGDVSASNLANAMRILDFGIRKRLQDAVKVGQTK